MEVLMPVRFTVPATTCTVPSWFRRTVQLDASPGPGQYPQAIPRPSFHPSPSSSPLASIFLPHFPSTAVESSTLRMDGSSSLPASVSSPGRRELIRLISSGSIPISRAMISICTSVAKWYWGPLGARTGPQTGPLVYTVHARILTLGIRYEHEPISILLLHWNGAPRP